MNIEIKADDKQFKQLFDALEEIPEEAKKACVSAINKTIAETNTNLQKAITTKYNIKKNELSGNSKYKSVKSNNLIKVERATFKDMSAAIDIRGTALTLNRFRPSPDKMPTTKKGRTNVTVQVTKGRKMKIDQSKKPFVLKVYEKKKNKLTGKVTVNKENGIVGIFSRENPGRKMKMLRTLSTAAMARQEDVYKDVVEQQSKTLDKKIEQEIKYRLSKIDGGD